MHVHVPVPVPVPAPVHVHVVSASTHRVCVLYGVTHMRRMHIHAHAVGAPSAGCAPQS